MIINYFEPLSSAINRMTSSLFKPFDFNKWLIFGFSAFLAGLLDGPGGNFGNFDGDDYNGYHFWDGPNRAWEWLNSNPFWFLMIGIGVIILIALILVFTWLSSRGAFLFIDNVVTDKAEILKPWNEFKKEGNSVFIWRVVFGLIITILISIFAVFALVTIVGVSAGDFSALATLSSIFLLGFPFLIVMIILAYISMFMNNFVIPIMYKHRISAMSAWGKFMSIFRANVINFILYGLLLLLLHIVVGIAVMMIGLFTCCIGFLFLIIPYVSSVILLPITYTYRAFSLEFLEQFGDDFKLFIEEELDPEF